ncbi:hypothetical protein LOC71_10435 [Rhodopirellula sp. JC740]|uniref:Uncharacterized protein n=1 Tax=Rhodopirellula halodulae TaxID=2894198 RepID=A0ABS8NGL5_9BACT|nr:hypothetical protein [Rhodopirellula sp. JC740]
MPLRSSRALLTVVGIIWGLSAGAEVGCAQVVQLPSVRRFSSTGGMLIPDRGTGTFGGGSSYQSGRASRRGLSPGTAVGGSARAGGVSVSATIIDLEEMDRQILGDDPRSFAAKSSTEQTIADAKALVQNARRLLKDGERLRAQGAYELALHRLSRLVKDLSPSSKSSASTERSKAADPHYMFAYAKREYAHHFGQLPAWIASPNDRLRARASAHAGEVKW